MHIIILGAGNVGTALARNLVNEDNDVVLVDHNPHQLSNIKNRLDIQTVIGSASHPSVLIQAGIKQADLLIAVTAHDDTNMMACLIAHNLYKTPRTMARIRADDYYAYPELFHKSNIPVQMVINPEHLVTEHIIRVIAYPSISQLLYFSDNKSCLLSIENLAKDWTNGKTLAEITDTLKGIPVGLVAVFKQKQAILLTDDYRISPKDKIVFLSSDKYLHDILDALNRKQRPNKRIIIAGGGMLGCKLAQKIQDDYQVKLIEKNPLLAAELASRLHNVIVLQSDSTDRELLLSENIQDTDIFCALTDNDEANIISSLKAKYFGAKYTISLVNHDDCIELIEDSLIDYALSPQLIAIGHILSQLKRGSIVKIHSLQKEEAEVIEVIVEGTEQTSAVVGRLLSQIELPPHCILAGIIRGKTLHTHMAKLRIEAKDHIILLLLKKKYIRQLEALFQVNLDFIS